MTIRHTWQIEVLTVIYTVISNPVKYLKKYPVLFLLLSKNVCLYLISSVRI